MVEGESFPFWPSDSISNEISFTQFHWFAQEINEARGQAGSGLGAGGTSAFTQDMGMFPHSPGLRLYGCKIPGRLEGLQVVSSSAKRTVRDSGRGSLHCSGHELTH